MTYDPQVFNTIAWRIPNALTLIGSRSGDERNAMTTSWVSQLAMEPVLIGVSVEVTAVTHRLIDEGGSFTVNLWDATDARAFVKYAKPARDDGASLNDRPVRDAPSGAPVFDEAVAWLDCVVRARHDLGSHALFIGEVTDIAVRDEEARVASMADTRMKYGGVARH